MLLPNSITRSNNCVSSSWGYFSQMYQLYPVVLRSTKCFFFSDLFWVLFVLRCSKFYFPPKKKDIVFLCHTKSYPEVVIQLINRLRVVLHNYTISISTDLQWGRKLMYNYVQGCKSFGGTSRLYQCWLYIPLFLLFHIIYNCTPISTGDGNSFYVLQNVWGI